MYVRNYDVPKPITRPPVCVCATLRCHKTNHTEHPHDSTKTACFRYFLLHFRPPKSERSMILGTTEKPENQAKENTLTLGNQTIRIIIQFNGPCRPQGYGLALDPSLKYLRTAISVLFRLTLECWSKMINPLSRFSFKPSFKLSNQLSGQLSNFQTNFQTVLQTFK